MPRVGAEAVGDVDHRPRPGRRQGGAGREQRSRGQLAGDGGLARLLRQLRPEALVLEEHQPGGRAAELAGDADGHARLPPRAADQVVRPLGVADRGDADRQRRRRGHVPADHRDPLLDRQLGEAGGELEAGLPVEVGGDAEPHVRLPRPRSHRGEVAQRRRERLAADRPRRAPAAAEAEAVDQGVDGRRRRPGRDSDSGVVADPDPDPSGGARRGQRRLHPLRDRADQVELRRGAEPRALGAGAHTGTALTTWNRVSATEPAISGRSRETAASGSSQIRYQGTM